LLERALWSRVLPAQERSSRGDLDLPDRAARKAR
jgi:hypothetical protein